MRIVRWQVTKASNKYYFLTLTNLPLNSLKLRNDIRWMHEELDHFSHCVSEGTSVTFKLGIDLSLQEKSFIKGLIPVNNVHQPVHEKCNYARILEILHGYVRHGLYSFLKKHLPRHNTSRKLSFCLLACVVEDSPL